MNFIKCFKVDKIYIESVGERFNVLVGLINNKINIDGVDAILSEYILEGI